MQAAEYLAAQRVLNRIEVHPLGCWQFLGALNHRGYGVVRIAGKEHRAHRLVFESEVAAIADEMTLDHLCMNKRCVNPAHLEAVTRSENVRRQIAAGLSVVCSPHNAAKTHCKRGHKFDNQNTYVDPGTGARKCRTCSRATARERSRR